MTPEEFYEAVSDALKHPRHRFVAGEHRDSCEVCGEGEHPPGYRGWKELRSCADAVQDISGLLDQVYVPTKEPIRRAKKSDWQLSAAPCYISHGIEMLKIAREDFKVAGAVQTLERVRKALTSAGGALRHAEGKSPFRAVLEKDDAKAENQPHT